MTRFTFSTTESGRNAAVDQVDVVDEGAAISLAVRSAGEAIRDLVVADANAPFFWELLISDAVGEKVCSLAFSLSR